MNTVIYVGNGNNICGNKSKDLRYGFSNYDLVNNIINIEIK